MSGVLQAIAIGFVRFYQWFISPLLHMTGARCRYTPTCSEYAVDAIRLNGALYGTYQSIRRILRCHPWHPGGFDPPTPRGHCCADANEVEDHGRGSR